MRDIVKSLSWPFNTVCDSRPFDNFESIMSQTEALYYVAFVLHLVVSREGQLEVRVLEPWSPGALEVGRVTLVTKRPRLFFPCPLHLPGA